MVDPIRRKPVAQAFDILHFCDRAVAVDVGRFSVPPLRTPRTTTVCVPTTWLSPLPMLTRVRRLSASVPAPKGSASRILKRTSHITVVVASKEA